MDDERRRAEEEQERPRPRVVDKRVSARPPADESAAPPEPRPETPTTPVEAPPATPTPPVETPPAQSAAETPPTQAEPPPGPAERVWTPQQEEQAQRIAEELARTPGPDLVLTFAMNFVEVASVKLEAGDLAGAQLAIDAFEGIVGAVGPQLGEAEGPMRSVLAQLQMAYAARAAGPA
jgi:hypothetical protein